MEAIAGDADRAVSLLTEALQSGLIGWAWVHASALADLGQLRDDTRIAQLLSSAPPLP